MWKVGCLCLRILSRGENMRIFRCRNISDLNRQSRLFGRCFVCISASAQIPTLTASTMSDIIFASLWHSLFSPHIKRLKICIIILVALDIFEIDCLYEICRFLSHHLCMLHAKLSSFHIHTGGESRREEGKTQWSWGKHKLLKTTYCRIISQFQRSREKCPQMLKILSYLIISIR